MPGLKNSTAKYRIGGAARRKSMVKSQVANQKQQGPMSMLGRRPAPGGTGTTKQMPNQLRLMEQARQQQQVDMAKTQPQDTYGSSSYGLAKGGVVKKKPAVKKPVAKKDVKKGK